MVKVIKKVKEIRCPHGRRKSHCKCCAGSQICIHSRRKQECTECARCDLAIPINRNICRVCRGKHLSKRRRIVGVCATCFTKRPPRTEHVFGDMIISEVGFEPNLKDQVVSLEECVKRISSRRPDLVWIIPERVIVVVEIDEDSHAGYSAQAEISKIKEQNDALRRLQNCEETVVFTIRVNPDVYDGARTTVKERARVVGGMVKQCIRGKITSARSDNIVFAYYHSKASHLIREQSKHFSLINF